MIEEANLYTAAATDREGYQPAQNIEAEQALLGAVLINNQAFDHVSGFLLADHFYQPVHGRIYQAALDMVRADQVASPVTLKHHFDNDESLSEVGGASYLARLVGSALTVINAKQYGQAIVNAYAIRELADIGAEITETATGPYVEPRGVIEATEARIFWLNQQLIAEGAPNHIEHAAAAALTAARAARERGTGLDGVATGYTDLDRLLGGMSPSDLLILAARPGMGKTALATCIAENAAKAGKKVAYFSLEMPADQLGRRLLSRATNIAAKPIRTGQLDDADFDRLDAAAEAMRGVSLRILDDSSPTISKIRAQCARFQRTGLDLVVIDYLQLIGASAEAKRRNRVDEVTEITTGLKALAKDIKAPVLALSQLSRAVESRDDKRPQLSDLRDSGTIEQDADLVIFLHRAEYYLEKDKPQDGAAMADLEKWESQIEQVRNLCDVIVAKHRNGETGAVRLRFDGKTTSFENLAHQGGFEL